MRGGGANGANGGEGNRMGIQSSDYQDAELPNKRNIKLERNRTFFEALKTAKQQNSR